jgi:hypothetical protein
MAMSVNKIRPLFDYLLIEPLNRETTLPSELLFRIRRRKPQGEIISGIRKEDDSGNKIPTEVKADIVMYKNGAEPK